MARLAQSPPQYAKLSIDIITANPYLHVKPLSVILFDTSTIYRLHQILPAVAIAI